MRLNCQIQRIKVKMVEQDLRIAAGKNSKRQRQIFEIALGDLA